MKTITTEGLCAECGGELTANREMKPDTKVKCRRCGNFIGTWGELLDHANMVAQSRLGLSLGCRYADSGHDRNGEVVPVFRKASRLI